MQIVHVLSRGVDKRKIFMDKQDHFRFIHDLFEFNDQESVNNVFYRFNKQSNDIVSHYIGGERKSKKRKLLVDIYAFCLMPNHYHLLLSPKAEGGISTFMRKLNVGYAKYFNQKYERTGALFEGRYKSVPVSNEKHFIHLPYYIHLNPLDLVLPEWRQRELKNYQVALDFLEKYRWSSFLDYTGKKNFPSVTQREFLSEFFGGPDNFRRDITKWLKEIDLESIKHLALE
jgi:putative transposase